MDEVWCVREGWLLKRATVTHRFIRRYVALHSDGHLTYAEAPENVELWALRCVWHCFLPALVRGAARERVGRHVLPNEYLLDVVRFLCGVYAMIRLSCKDNDLLDHVLRFRF
jgi:hypothetical protein